MDQPSRRTWTWYACGGLVALHAALLVWSAGRASITFDEYAHLPAGVAYWKYREFSVHNLSPPLVRLLCAWPAVLAGADAPPSSSYRKFDERVRHWTYAEDFLRANFHDRYPLYFVLGRLALIPISCAGALLVFAWARSLCGELAGLASCALYSIDPNILAHASLITTDVPVAVALLGGTWLWQRFVLKPTAGAALAASLTVAAAVLIKFTALLIVPVMLGVAAWGIVLERRRWKSILTGLLVATIVVWFCINLMYGYWRTFEPLRSLELQSATLRGAKSVLPGGMPVPLPRLFVLGFDAQKYEAELLPPAYALGEQYRGARWYYYPLALGCKLPVGTIMMLLLLLVLLARRGLRREEWPLVIMLVVFALGMAGLAQVNLGMRYILPILPPAFVIAGRLFERASASRWIGSALIVIAATESLAVAPRFLTFFNVACGGAPRGQFILNDSNFDWGQGLLDLRDWMERHRVDRIGLAYFGRVDPGVYGIEYSPLIGDETLGDEALVAVSSYYLTGMPHRMPTPAGPTDHLSLPYFRELQRKKPLAVVGRTIYIFRREDVAAARRERGLEPQMNPNDRG